MQIDIITLFPEMITAPLAQSIIGRAQEGGLVSINVHQLRDWAPQSKDKINYANHENEAKLDAQAVLDANSAIGENVEHSLDKANRAPRQLDNSDISAKSAQFQRLKVDDTIYGGGQGMLLQAEPIFAAVEELRTELAYVILMTPQGQVFKQQLAQELGSHQHLIIICGHYEGVDYRVIEELVDLELSIGDYILTNGAIAATVVVDSIVRLLPNVLGNEQSCIDESFSDSSLLEAPAYSKPANFRGLEVPPVLLSGDHAKIAQWRQEQAIKRTQQNRPDLNQG